MANADTASVRAKAVLPNLLLATTYALNKSNSKRAIVGLDYAGGLYKPVVKLCSSGSPAKYVTLDAHGWELIVDQMDVMTAFFQNSYAFYGTFGNPSRIFLPNLDLIYKSSYGSKSVCFEERPVGMVTNLSQRVEPSPSSGSGNVNESMHSSLAALAPSAQSTSGGNTVNGTDVVSSSGNGGGGGGGGGDMQPPCKRKRYDTPPSCTIQEPTFIGLKDVCECIVTRMNYLVEISLMVNRMADYIVIYLHQKLAKEDTERVKSILKDTCNFKKFFMANYVDIHANARKAIDSSISAKDQTTNILILELTAFGLPWISKHVNDLLQKS